MEKLFEQPKITVCKLSVEEILMASATDPIETEPDHIVTPNYPI